MADARAELLRPPLGAAGSAGSAAATAASTDEEASTSYGGSATRRAAHDHEQDREQDHAHGHDHDGLTFPQYMLAGSLAGMVEHMAMFPVDLVKTRMQVLAEAGAPKDQSVGKALVLIMQREGALGMWRGIGAMGLGAGPAHAVYFAVYEKAKEALGGNEEGYHPLAHAASGALATIASDAVFTPMDVVKQRLQLRRSPYRGVLDCFSRILREEGVRALYASYKTTVIMNVPFTAVHFATYEAAKKLLMEVSPKAVDEEQLLIHVTAGGLSGALAGAITTPLDVVKTRLQCQGVCGASRFRSTSVRQAMRRIVEEEGPRALWRGLRPRVMFHAPAAAICWSTYEASKSFLQDWNQRQRLKKGQAVQPHPQG